MRASDVENGSCVVCVAALLLSLVDTARIARADDELRMNQLQVIGTHNSYHVRDKPIKSGRASEWNYTHPPLDVQLDRGVRSFELDLHWRGGEFLVFHVPIIDEGYHLPHAGRSFGDSPQMVRGTSPARADLVPV